MEQFKSYTKYPKVHFTPDNISWKILREWAVTATAFAALLEQVAHPLVAAGVSQKSGFAKGPYAEVTHVSKQIADSLLTLASPMGSLCKPITKTFAVGFMNEELRKQYDLSWNKLEELFFSLTCKIVQRLVGYLPPRIRFVR